MLSLNLLLMWECFELDIYPRLMIWAVIFPATFVSAFKKRTLVCLLSRLFEFKLATTKANLSNSSEFNSSAASWMFVFKQFGSHCMNMS